MFKKTLLQVWNCLQIMVISIVLSCNQPARNDTMSTDLQASEQKWELVNPSKTVLPTGYVIYGNNVYVSVGVYDLQKSNDGQMWQTVAKKNSCRAQPNDISFGNNTFVVVDGQNILSSTDGSTWKITTDTSRYILSIAFGNGVFVIAGTKGHVAISKDGDKWENHDLDTSMDFSSIAYGKGRFVAASSEQIISSIDGVTWTESTNFEGHGVESYVIFGNGKFLFSGSDNYASDDGLYWTQVDPLGSYTCFLNDKFITPSYSNGSSGQTITISNDLISREVLKTDLRMRDPLLTFLNGQYLAIDRSLCTFVSTDLIHWTIPNSITTNTLNDVAFGNELFVATGVNGTVITSSSGSLWTKVKSSVVENLNSVAFGNNLFIIAGDSGTVLNSSDGVTWSVGSSGCNNKINKVFYVNGRFIAASYSNNGFVLVSGDGKRWEHYKTGLMQYYQLNYGNGMIVAVGKDSAFVNSAFVSLDGMKWERAIIPDCDIRQLFFDGSSFIVEGSDRETSEELCLKSDDGNWWQRSTRKNYSFRESIQYSTGKTKIIDKKLFWQVSDTGLYRIQSKVFEPLSVCYGNDVFVGVGDYGRIAILKAKSGPENIENRKLADSILQGPFEHKKIIGLIDNVHVIQMNLTSDGKRLRGNYVYTGHKDSLNLEGIIDSKGVFYCKEYAGNGKNTGSFIGKLKEMEILGEWRSADSVRKLAFEGYGITDEQIAARLESFREKHKEYVGCYSVSSISGSEYANLMYDCNFENNEWKCSASSINQGWRERIEDFNVDYSQYSFQAMHVKVCDDFTIEFYVNGKTYLKIPLLQNKFVYFSGGTAIAKNIKVDKNSNPDEIPERYSLHYDGDGFSLKGNPTVIFKKSSETDGR